MIFICQWMFCDHSSIFLWLDWQSTTCLVLSLGTWLVGLPGHCAYSDVGQQALHLVWMLLLFCHFSVACLLQYTAAELLWFHHHLTEPPRAVLNHLDIACPPRQRYIDRGSSRNFHHDNSKAVKSFWSTSHCPHRNIAWSADPTALASQFG